ncbi:hypothetical protein CPJCM30710_28920 [Clostridium polyendosporum]|uniref:6-phosphogluconolactonase n=1 Tax=Clostridium polyendosporum TaxID=69208 RepID=A0A919VHY7_9CLOT|nr:lactonase family protein [Clostridium polyendosporum]GIM30226.1 hypothetical protein CPJCM30710_28920 [Clostridium polyendosporum]
MSKKVPKLTAYVGTYTNGKSEGIYSFSLDTTSGNIDEVKLAAKLENPTYLSINKNNQYLYSVIKVGEAGGVAAFSINNLTKSLELLNYQVSDGKPPCHVSLDSKNNYVFSANYHKGNVEVFLINKDGSINAASSTITHEGSGPNKARQEKAHVHYVDLTPDEKYLCTVDLGIDKLVIYKLNNGTLLKLNDLSLKPESGPRHMDFHPNGRFAYIITELSSEVIALEYSPSECNFKELQYISTLPDRYNNENLGGAIHISPDGRYLYASNRGHDSIAVFSIDNLSGKLKLISHNSTEGLYPRDFSIDPTGKFLVVVNQNSNNIVPFLIDRTTGKLTQINSSVFIPNPVCVKFFHI